MVKYIINVCGMLLLCAALITGCGNINHSTKQDYVLTIDKAGVTKQEAYIYLYETYENFVTIGGEDIWDTNFDGTSAADAAKQNALKSLIAVNIGAKKAVEYNLVLSENQKDQAKQEAETFLETMPNEFKSQFDINLAHVTKVMEDKALYSLLVEKTTKDYVVNLQGFDGFWQENKEEYTDYYNVIEASYLEFDESQKAIEVYNQAKSESDFNELLDVYGGEGFSLFENNPQVMYKGEFESIINKTIEVLENNVLAPININGKYYVFKYTLVEADVQTQAKDIAKQDYEFQMKQQFFNDEYSKWEAKSTVSINGEIWNDIQIQQIKDFK